MDYNKWLEEQAFYESEAEYLSRHPERSSGGAKSMEFLVGSQAEMAKTGNPFLDDVPMPATVQPRQAAPTPTQAAGGGQPPIIPPVTTAAPGISHQGAPWWGSGYGGLPQEQTWYARQVDPTRYLPEAAKARWRGARRIFEPTAPWEPRQYYTPQTFPEGTGLPAPPRGEEWLTRGGAQAYPTSTLEAIWPRTASGEFILGVPPGSAMKRAQLAVQEALIPTMRGVETSAISMGGYPQERGGVYNVGVLFGGVLPEGMGRYLPGTERFGASELFSVKSMGVKAYMAPGRVPTGTEMLLPTPKDPIGFARGVLSALAPGQLQALGLPVRGGKLEWTGETHQQIMQAAGSFIEEAIRPERFQFRVTPELEAAYRGRPGVSISGGQVTMEVPMFRGQMMLQPRAEHMGKRPVVNPEEMAHLLQTSPRFGERLWRESAGFRRTYQEPVQAMLGTLQGTPFGQLPWEQVGARVRELQPEGRIGLSTLVSAAARSIRTPISTMMGGQQVTFPSPQTMLRLRSERELLPLEEEEARRNQARIFSLYGRWMRGSLGMHGGLSERVAEHAGMGLITEMGKFASSGNVQRMMMSAAPRRAIEGPPVASPALAPEEMVLGRGALTRMFGVQTPEQMRALQSQLRTQEAVARVWRRPLSDPGAQMAMRLRVITEEMAQERGAQLGPLGSQFAVSPFAMFIGIGDVDADRLIAVLESKAVWQPETRWGPRTEYAGRVDPGFWEMAGGKELLQEQGSLPQRFLEMMQVHAPEKTRGMSPEDLFSQFTTEWEEAYQWRGKLGAQTPEEMREWFFQQHEATPGTLLESAREAMVAKQQMGLTYQAFGRALKPYMGGREEAGRAIMAGSYMPPLDIRPISEELKTGLESFMALGARTGSMARRLHVRPGEEMGFEEMGKGKFQIGRLGKIFAGVEEWPAYARAQALAPRGATQEEITGIQRLIEQGQFAEAGGMARETSPVIAMMREQSMGRGLGQQGWQEVRGGGRRLWRMGAEEQAMGGRGLEVRRMLNLESRRGVPIGELKETFRQRIAATPALSKLFGRVFGEMGIRGAPTDISPMMQEVAQELGAEVSPRVLGQDVEAAVQRPGGLPLRGLAQPPSGAQAQPGGVEEYTRQMRAGAGAPRPAAGGGGARVPPSRPTGQEFPGQREPGEGGVWLPFGEQEGFAKWTPEEGGAGTAFVRFGAKGFSDEFVTEMRSAARNLQRWNEGMSGVIRGTREMTPALTRAVKLMAGWSETMTAGQNLVQQMIRGGREGEIPAEARQLIGAAGAPAQRWGWMAPYAQELAQQQTMAAAFGGGGPGGGGRGGGGLWGDQGFWGGPGGAGGFARRFPRQALRRLAGGWGFFAARRFIGAAAALPGQMITPFAQQQLMVQQAAFGAEPVDAGVAGQGLQFAQYQAQLGQQRVQMGRGAWDVYAPLLQWMGQQQGAGRAMGRAAAIAGPAMFGALLGTFVAPGAGTALGAALFALPGVLSGLGVFGQVPQPEIPPAVQRAERVIADVSTQTGLPTQQVAPLYTQFAQLFGRPPDVGDLTGYAQQAMMGQDIMGTARAMAAQYGQPGAAPAYAQRLVGMTGPQLGKIQRVLRDQMPTRAAALWDAGVARRLFPEGYQPVDQDVSRRMGLYMGVVEQMQQMGLPTPPPQGDPYQQIRMFQVQPGQVPGIEAALGVGRQFQQMGWAVPQPLVPTFGLGANVPTLEMAAGFGRGFQYAAGRAAMDLPVLQPRALSPGEAVGVQRANEAITALRRADPRAVPAWLTTEYLEANETEAAQWGAWAQLQLTNLQEGMGLLAPPEGRAPSWREIGGYRRAQQINVERKTLGRPPLEADFLGLAQFRTEQTRVSRARRWEAIELQAQELGLAAPTLYGAEPTPTQIAGYERGLQVSAGWQQFGFDVPITDVTPQQGRIAGMQQAFTGQWEAQFGAARRFDMTPFQMQRAGAWMQGQPRAWSAMLRARAGGAGEWMGMPTTTPGLDLGMPDAAAAAILDPTQYMQRQWGIQDQMTGLQRRFRDVGLGIQQEQLGARRAYTGRVWGIQDRMTALGYRQQEAQLRQQEQGRQLQGRQFREGWQLSMEQFGIQTGYQRQRMGFGYETGLLQRGWQRADWETGEATGRMQFGWRQADLARGLRYARGPERAQIQRQQRRERVLENERRRQFEENKDRQEELWSRGDEQHGRDVEYFEENTQLQEERLQMQRRHFEEREDLQESFHNKSKSFMTERRDLEEELRTEQRTWQEEQFAWEEEALERQIEYNEEMDEYQDAQKGVQRQYDALQATILDFLFDADEKAEEIAEWIAKWNTPTAGSDRPGVHTEEGCTDAGGTWVDGQCRWVGSYQFGGIVSQDMVIPVHRGEIIVNPKFPRADLAEAIRQTSDSGSGDALLRQILAALLQLQNVFRDVNLVVDGKVIAAVFSPYLEEGNWDQSHQF